MKEEEEQLYFEKGQKKINWMQILGFAVMEVIKASNKPLSLNEENRDSYFNAVIALDRTLQYYKDDSFEKELRSIAAHTQPFDKITTLDEFQDWYGLCCKQIGKKDMLPEESITMRDEYDTIESSIFVPKKSVNTE